MIQGKNQKKYFCSYFDPNKDFASTILDFTNIWIVDVGRIRIEKVHANSIQFHHIETLTNTFTKAWNFEMPC